MSSDVPPHFAAHLRIGIGHDTHRLADGGPLVIGGCTVAWDRHLVGHSDADVLLHAVIDALLGAAALGDIGDHFPDTDDRQAGRDSGQMLTDALALVRAEGFTVINIDCIIHAQRPKLGPVKRRIAERIADLLAVTTDRVGVKAKTGESVGPIGREEAISAECVALLARGGG